MLLANDMNIILEPLPPVLVARRVYEHHAANAGLCRTSCLSLKERVQHLFPVLARFQSKSVKDQTPEFVHVVGDCFLASTATNSSWQEAETWENVMTSCPHLWLCWFGCYGVLCFSSVFDKKRVGGGRNVQMRVWIIWQFISMGNPTKVCFNWVQLQTCLSLSSIRHKSNFPLFLNIKALRMWQALKLELAV